MKIIIDTTVQETAEYIASEFGVPRLDFTVECDDKVSFTKRESYRPRLIGDLVCKLLESWVKPDAEPMTAAEDILLA